MLGMSLLRKYAVVALLTITGRHYRKELRTIELIDSGEVPLKDFVEESLRSLVTYAKDKVPHYSVSLRGVDDPVTHFDRIPVLRRSFLQNHVRELISTEIEGMRVITGTTGGSTARPVRFYRDMRSYRWGKATEIFYYSRFLGVDLLEAKKVVLWGSASELLDGIPFLSRIAHFVDGTTYFNAYLLDERLMERILRRLDYYRPDILRGLPHFLAAVAEYALRRGIKAFRPKVVISTGETLTERRRNIIEEVFGRVYDFYGSREVPSIAGECERGSLHLFAFNNLVEILDDRGRVVPAGGLGNIVVTSLHNYAMPLIRYEIGDVARAVEGGCGCDSILPVMGRVEGRITEFVVRRDGSMLGGEFFEGVFRVEDWVGEFQVIQEDLDTLRILVAPKEGKRPSLQRVERKVRSVLGDVTLRWEFVDRIPRPPSGKFMYVVSKVRSDLV